MCSGGSAGSIGMVVDAALAAGGKVIGVVLDLPAEREGAHPGLTELQLVPSVSERDAALADLSDGFLALPGGLGTLEELFDIWTWGSLGFNEKPCGLLNIADYYTTLLKTVDDAVVEKFVRETQRGMLIVDRDPEVLLRAVADFRPPETRRLMPLEDS
ncbi:MAG: TIGR00730 family Rossman fold protein [Gemmatimonadales bacterium]|nr:TIGR00730 family Rossman fold protein [Gemmatimonadales bacterium]